VKITVIATGFDEAAIQKTATTPAKIFSSPSKVVVSSAPVISTPPPQQSIPATSPAAQRPRQDMGETDVRLAGSESEDLFRSSGVPVNQLDIPAYLRKKKP
jgi:hypothetical protein